MIADWENFLRTHAAQWNVPSDGHRWTCLMYNNYHPHCSSITLLWFRDEVPDTAVVAKLYRDPAIPQREFANLQHAYDGAPGVVPRPLYCGSTGDLWGLWTEGLPGTMFRQEDARNRTSLQAATHAVFELHAGVRQPGKRSLDERMKAVVAGPLGTVAGFGGSDIVRRGCDALRARIRPEQLRGLPEIPQHGDLFFGNFILNNNRCGIVDWESFGQVTLPAYDLLTFYLSLLRAEGEDPNRWPEWLLRQIPGALTKYCASMNVDRSALAWLLPLTLVNWFHVQWTDGREAFSRGLYSTLEKYFANESLWASRILGASAL